MSIFSMVCFMVAGAACVGFVYMMILLVKTICTPTVSSRARRDYAAITRETDEARAALFHEAARHNASIRR